MASTETTPDDLAKRLEELLEVEPLRRRRRTFVARRDARHRDSLYERPRRIRWRGGRSRRSELHWFSEWDTVLTTPTRRTTSGSTAGRSTRPTTASTVTSRRARRPGRDALARRGGRGARHHVRVAARARQRFANVAEGPGVEPGDVVGIFMPMIPEVIVAMLACARIGAPHNVVFGGFSPESVRERMETSEAKALVTVDGARRKGKTAPIKPEVDDVMGDVASIEKIFVRQVDGHRLRDAGGPRRLVRTRSMEAASPECEAVPLDAEHPLFILYSSGSTNKPKGILHATGGYLTGVAWTTKHVFDLKPETDVYWCAADVGWITGHSYIVYGPLLNGAHPGHVRGAAGLPVQGPPLEAGRRPRGHDLLLRADRHPVVHEVGRGAAGQARPLVAAAARDGRRADQPEGLALVPRGDRPRRDAGRRHLVADRDRPHHDHDRSRARST